MLVLVVLAVIWGIVLGPPALRWYADRKGGGTDSISRFHRNLHVLEHSGSPAVPPAYRLAAPVDAERAVRSQVPELHAKPALTLVTGDAPRPPALAFLSEQSPADHLPGGASDRRTGTPDPGVPRPEYGSRTVRQRRRDVLAVMVAIFLLTAALGAIPSMGAIWVVTFLDAVVGAAYVATLVHLRVQAEERDRLLRSARELAGEGEDRWGDGERLVSVSAGAPGDDWELGVDIGYDLDEIARGYSGADPVALRACRRAHPSSLAIAN